MVSWTSSSAALCLLLAPLAPAHGGKYALPEGFVPPEPHVGPLPPPTGPPELRRQDEVWQSWWRAEREVRRVTRHPTFDPPEPDIGEGRSADPLAPTEDERMRILDALLAQVEDEDTDQDLREAACLALARCGDARVRAHLPGLSQRVALLAEAWVAPRDLRATIADLEVAPATRHLAALLLLHESPKNLEVLLASGSIEDAPAFVAPLRFAAALEHADRLDHGFVVSIENPNRRRVARSSYDDTRLTPQLLAPWIHDVASPGSLDRATREHLHQLLRSTNPAHRDSALLTLARRGMTPEAREHAEAAQAEGGRRATAMLALALCGTEPPDGLEEMETSGPLVLALTGGSEAWQTLHAQVRERGPNTPIAIEALTLLPQPSRFLTTDVDRDLWTSLVLAEDEGIASAAAYACGQLRIRAMGGELLAALGAPRSEPHALEIARAIGALGDRRFVAPLLERLSDDERSDEVRTRAALALGLLLDDRPSAWSSWYLARGVAPEEAWWLDLRSRGGF